ncbi:MAG: hypothetical protein D6782_11265 [Alphaproteobacteria bacterium]|nr:MAG: hypothetical protein D6782_11265 [Alphaproteobacteria bacterium]
MLLPLAVGFGLAAPPLAAQPPPDAAAAKQRLADDAPDKQRHPRCLSTPSIRDTHILDNRTIIVRMSGGMRYKMVLAYECFGLKFHETFYYRVRSSQLCVTDVIIARGGSNCPIDYFELMPDDTDADGEAKQADGSDAR